MATQQSVSASQQQALRAQLQGCEVCWDLTEVAITLTLNLEFIHAVFQPVGVSSEVLVTSA